MSQRLNGVKRVSVGPKALGSGLFCESSVFHESTCGRWGS
jgi:hypothetical protein